MSKAIKPKYGGFTRQQLNDWQKYEEVRQGGRYNMLFPQARRATGLSESRYSFTLDNYSALKDAIAELERAKPLEKPYSIQSAPGDPIAPEGPTIPPDAQTPALPPKDAEITPEYSFLAWWRRISSQTTIRNWSPDSIAEKAWACGVGMGVAAAAAPASVENTPAWLHGWRQGMSDAVEICERDGVMDWKQCRAAIMADRDARK